MFSSIYKCENIKKEKLHLFFFLFFVIMKLEFNSLIKFLNLIQFDYDVIFAPLKYLYFFL